MFSGTYALICAVRILTSMSSFTVISPCQAGCSFPYSEAPVWYKYGSLACGMVASRSVAYQIYTRTEFFLKQIGSTAFGICVIPKASHRHETSLRWLLIVSGDVELNPGPMHTEIVNLSDSPELTTTNRFAPLTSNATDEAEPSCSYAPAPCTKFTCRQCRREFTRRGHLKRHLEYHERERAASTAPDIPPKRPKTEPVADSQTDYELKLIFSGLKNVFKIYRVFTKKTFMDTKWVAGTVLDHLTELIEDELTAHAGVKAHLRFAVKFFKPLEQGVTTVAYFVSKPATYLATSDSASQLHAAATDIDRQIDEFTNNGSGWSVQHIEHFDFYMSRYKPVRLVHIHLCRRSCRTRKRL